ncbi:hypothetical protein GC173_09855 [bacterium]|nr:hypothetical protein [bacterium]
MPLYEYRCEANGETVQVRHPMSERLKTWGQVCERLGMHHGETPPEEPVERQLGGGTLLLQRRGAGHVCSGDGCCG